MTFIPFMRRNESFIHEVALMCLSLIISFTLFNDPNVFSRSHNSYALLMQYGQTQIDWAVFLAFAALVKAIGLTLHALSRLMALSRVCRWIGLLASAFIWAAFAISYFDAPGSSVGAWPMLFFSGGAVWCLARNPTE